jgi:tetratricopeptide (TPR) repeat protein
MSASAVSHRITFGAAAVVALAFLTLPALAADTSPKPSERCSGYTEGSADWKKCMSQKLKDDEETYALGYWLAKTGDYQQALDVLRSAQLQADPRIQTMIGFSLRKLGMVDEAMAYYAAALRLAPDLTSTRQYLGEAYLQKGERSKALEQLAEIGRLGGTGSEHYLLLANAIAAAG